MDAIVQGVIGMDAGIVRGLGTLVLFLSFVTLCAWAWAPSQRRRFEDASLLPFRDDDDDDSASVRARRRNAS